MKPSSYRSLISLACASVVTALAGCGGAPEATFDLNLSYIKSQEFKTKTTLERQQIENIQDILVGMFGTPDEPHIPVVEGAETAKLFTQRELSMAAGPVGTDEAGRPRGLYRRHCAHCHGISGDGAGPTAGFLNPYPRDYRRGIYKFKSTPRTEPPTKSDLQKILHEGIAGTAMPSFKYLPSDELEALASYVRYLSVRGQVERLLVFEMLNEVDPGERLVDVSLKTSDPAALTEQVDLVKEFFSNTVGKWQQAETLVTEIPPRPQDWNMDESIAIGQKLFYGSVAACSKCHGETALGDGQTTDYDEWTKELEPTNKERLDLYLSLGSLPPRNIKPRNLRMGVYRGGRRPVDIFWRIHNGIAGSPMPAASVKPDDAPDYIKGLTTDDIWHIIDYVRSLPYESLSQPGNLPENQRQRL